MGDTEFGGCRGWDLTSNEFGPEYRSCDDYPEGCLGCRQAPRPKDPRELGAMYERVGRALAGLLAEVNEVRGRGEDADRWRLLGVHALECEKLRVTIEAGAKLAAEALQDLGAMYLQRPELN